MKNRVSLHTKCLFVLIAGCMLLGACSDGSVSDSHECNPDGKRFESCVCTDGIWECDCEENGDCIQNIGDCPSDCLMGCDEDGECLDNDLNCPDECQNNCDDDGVCIDMESDCPAECPNDCDDDGECNVHDTCPAECPNDCTDNVCNEHDTCPAECPNDCTENVCNEHDICPVECPNDCDETGKCNEKPVECPAECAGDCNKYGECPLHCGTELVEKLYFSQAEIDLLVPGSRYLTTVTDVLSIKTENSTYTLGNAPCAASIEITCDNNDVLKAEKSEDGVKFTAIKAGRAICTATLTGKETISTSLKLHVLNLEHFNDDLTEKRDGKYIHLHSGPDKQPVDTRVSQGYDFLEPTKPYFSQLANTLTLSGTKYLRVAQKVFRQKSSTSYSDPMVIYGFGHGQGMSLESTDSDDFYVWTGNYGSLDNETDKGYRNSQTISRMKFAGGKTYWNTDIKDQYIYPLEDTYYRSMEPCIDQVNNRFAFRAIYSKSKEMHFKVFALDEVKKLERTSIKLGHAITTTKDKSKLVTITPTIEAKDLSKARALSEFSLSKWWNQGFDLENNIIYGIENLPQEIKTDSKGHAYQSRITIYAYSLKGEKIGTYYLRTKNSKDRCAAYTSTPDHPCLDNDDMDAMINKKEDGVQYYNNGYYEPEGFRVEDGKAYVSVISRWLTGKKVDGKLVLSNQKSRQFVFVYDLTE